MLVKFFTFLLDFDAKMKENEAKMHSIKAYSHMLVDIKRLV